METACVSVAEASTSWSSPSGGLSGGYEYEKLNTHPLEAPRTRFTEETDHQYKTLSEFRKRGNDSLGESSGIDAKKSCTTYYFVLQSESEQPTDEDTESVDSIQLQETDYAKDTSDTSTHSDSDWSTRYVAMDVEYEPVSLSEGEGPVDNGGDSATSTDVSVTLESSNSCEEDGDDIWTSSTVEDVIVGSILTATLDDDLALWADDSEDSNSSTTYDPEVSPKDYWTCLQCKCKNNHPMYRYCEKCFRLRKDSFPPRPKPSGKRKMKNNLAQVSSVASSTMSSQFPPIVQEATSSNQTSSDQSSPIVQEITCSSSTLNIMLERTSSAPVMDSNFGSIQDSSSLPHTSALERAASFPMVDNSCGSSYALDTMNNKTNAASEMCIMCLIKPKNGAFIHTKDVHVCCCYDCAVKTWLRHKRCPVCNKKAMNILRVYIV